MAWRLCLLVMEMGRAISASRFAPLPMMQSRNRDDGEVHLCNVLQAAEPNR